MGVKKITELEELVSVADDDVLLVVDISGTPTTKKIQKSNLAGISGYSGYSSVSGYSGYSSISGYSGYSSVSGYSGISGYSGYSSISGYSGYSSISGYSGYSGISGYSGYSGISGYSGYSGQIGGTTGTTDNAILRADGTGGTTVQSSTATLDDSGNVIFAGTLKVGGSSGGTFTDNNTTPSGTRDLAYDGYFYATRVYNAVWNDLADFIQLDEELDIIEYGKVYIRDLTGKIRLSSEYCEDGIIGLVTDTYGYGLGIKNIGKRELPIAVAGFPLAYVDKVYPTGTPLTCTKNGILTKIELIDKINNSERIIATYFKEEKRESINGVIVNNRHWVKIK